MLRHQFPAGRAERRQGDIERKAKGGAQRSGDARKMGRLGGNHALFHAGTLAWPRSGLNAAARV